MKDGQVLKPREAFEVWMKGCSCATSRKPWECEPCTVAFVGAMGRSLAEHAGMSMVDLRRELENVQTANHALRVELYATQQNLLAQRAATASLAQGVTLREAERLSQVSGLMAELAAAKTRIRGLEIMVERYKPTP